MTLRKAHHAIREIALAFPPLISSETLSGMRRIGKTRRWKGFPTNAHTWEGGRQPPCKACAGCHDRPVATEPMPRKAYQSVSRASWTSMIGMPSRIG